MKKTISTLSLIFILSYGAKAQIMVSKMLGKEGANYGLGYGMFTNLEIPMANANQAVRIDIDFSVFPFKGEKFFTATEYKAYASGRLGYKYVLSESNTGFYLLPSAGYCYITSKDDWGEVINSHGIAGAFETGYVVELGQGSNTLNLGVKYEYGRGGKNQSVQTVGLRLAFAFGLFRKKEW